MPLSIRPLQAADAAPLRARFGGNTRPPWMRLPYPYTLESLLVPTEGITVFVAEATRTQAAGLIAIDETGPAPQLVGPLVPDEQLADLIGLALLNHGLAWVERVGYPQVHVKVDLSEDRGIDMFIAHGFQVLERQQYVLTVRPGDIETLPPVPPGLRLAPCPELVSSDYLRVVQDAGPTLGAEERKAWSRTEVFQHLQETGLHVYAARNDVAVVGLAEFLDRGAGEGLLTYFGVLPAYQDEAIETMFLLHALRYAAEHVHLQLVTIEWLVADADRQVPFYLKAGFKRERAMVLLEKPLVGDATVTAI